MRDSTAEGDREITHLDDGYLAGVLELYQAEWCPYSHRVRERLTELGIDFVARQVEARPANRKSMLERTGSDTIPMLVLEDGSSIGDAETIVAYLNEHYEETEETDLQRAQARAHGVEPA
ncbi:MAG: glutathione S-transferase N-terminal domain-containing protein [Actinomycetota bacterium]|nr:glutathione S-transferase N-terminal domain-containing protein [Actinomycetota bacterium]